MHLLWILDHAHLGNEQDRRVLNIVKNLQKKGIDSSLLYNCLSKTDSRFLAPFNTAFPEVDLVRQIHDISPEVIFVEDKKKQETLTHILSQYPIFPLRCDQEIDTIIERIETTTRKEETTSQPPPLRTSVIIRTKNSRHVIEQTLKGLFSQEFRQFDVLVIDSSSTDNTLEIVKQYPEIAVLTLPEKEYFPGKILNYAIERVKGDILIFLNSDAVPLTPTTIHNLLHPFSDPHVKGSFARQISRPDALPWVLRDYSVAFPEKAPPPSWMPISFCLAAIRKETWKEHPFYTLAWGSEDTEWGNWATSRGYTIQYASQSLVMHSHNYTLRELYGRKFIEGEADAFIYNKIASFSSVLLSTLKATLKDLCVYIKLACWKGILMIPFRRFVYYWGYYRGNRLGNWRIKNQNHDASLGQKVLLERYQPQEPSEKKVYSEIDSNRGNK